MLNGVKERLRWAEKRAGGGKPQGRSEEPGSAFAGRPIAHLGMKRMV